MHTLRILHATPVETLQAYEALNGGHGLTAARYRSPDSLIELITASGLRGRGGAGFPTGRKWRSVASAGVISPPVVVNAAEGEPGTFKDRTLLRTNPYLIIEGACIAAHAMQSTDIIIAIKASFRKEIERVHTAIREVADAGWTDELTIRVVEGPSEYLFGEETALLEVIDGRQPFPRVAPPYRRGIRTAHTDATTSISGDDRAVLVDNVETLANVVGIVRHGADWYRSLGTADSPGTIICTVTGATRRAGVGEFAMGTTLREVLEAVGHGTSNDRAIAAVLNGVSNPVLGPDQLDTPLTYEDMAGAGSGLGSASFIVIDEDEPLLSVAAGVARFLSIESCGQCSPCKRDGLAIAEMLRDGEIDEVNDRLNTVARGARCALAGQTERVVGSIMALAAEAMAETTSPAGLEPYPIVPLVDIVDNRAVFDVSFAEKQSDWSFASEAADSFSWPAQHLSTQLVTIHPPRTPEPTGRGTKSTPTRDPVMSVPFAALHEAHDRIEASLDELRTAAVPERSTKLKQLRSDIDHHRRAMEHVVYPLVSRLDPAVGDDITWYPEHHEKQAVRILDRLDVADALSPRLIDELCADVHASILEINLRVLPDLQRAISSNPAEERLVSDAVDEFLAM